MTIYMTVLPQTVEKEEPRREQKQRDRGAVEVKDSKRMARKRHQHNAEPAGNQQLVRRRDMRIFSPNGSLSTGARQTSVAALGAVAAYATIRGSIKFFHHARRGMLRQMLLDVCPNLSHCNYWLDFGSLLGIHRDGDLILHDNDVDLAILDPNWPELLDHLHKALPQYCVRLEIPSEAPDVSFLRVYCALGFADLFGAREMKDGRLLVDCGHGEVTCIESRLVVPTESLEWRGVSVKVPRNLEGALHARYGPTWRTPRYMDKGADTVEGNKTYAKLFRALAKLGIRL